MTSEQLGLLNIGDMLVLDRVTSSTASEGIPDEFIGGEFELIGIGTALRIKGPDGETWHADYRDLTPLNAVEQVERTEDIDKFIQGIKDCTQRVYPDNSEVLTIGSKLQVTLYFPEKTVQNDEDLEHTIYDVFLRITFSTNTKKLTMIQGTRSTRSVLELKKQYVHSHICPTTPCRFENLCFSSDTDLAINRDELRIAYDELKYESVLYMLEDFLEYESLDGGPYSGGLTNLLTSSDTIQVPRGSQMSDMYYYFRRSTITPELKITQHGDFSSITLSSTPEYEKGIYDRFKDGYPELVVLNTGTGIAGIGDSVSTQEDYDKYLRGYRETKVVFKGKDYNFKLLKDEIKLVLPEGDLVMHPHVGQYFIKELEKDVHKFYYDSYNPKVDRVAVS